jgi:hypothetical protein
MLKVDHLSSGRRERQTLPPTTPQCRSLHAHHRVRRRLRSASAFVVDPGSKLRLLGDLIQTGCVWTMAPRTLQGGDILFLGPT